MKKILLSIIILLAFKSSYDLSPYNFKVPKVNVESFILMDANPKTNEKISSFIKIQKILSEYGINVPKIYKKNVSLGLMIIQDLGKKKFLDYVNDSTSKKNLYTSCKSVLIKIHSRSIERPSKIKNIP